MSVIIVNDLLTYTYCKLNSTSGSNVFKIIKDFYSTEKIALAHSILCEWFPENISNSSITHIEDIIDFILSTSYEMLPIFICSNNFNIPKLTSTPESSETKPQENLLRNYASGKKDNTINFLKCSNERGAIHLTASKLDKQTGSQCNKRKSLRKTSENINLTATESCFVDNGEKSKVRYVCPKCKYIVDCKTILKKHLAGHHAGYTNQCLNCFDVFATWEDIKEHEIQCPRTKRAAQLNAHYECSHCKSRFCNKKSLNSHEAYHDDSRQFACKKCGYRFYTQQSLDTHSEVHSGSIHRCPYCEYGSATKSRVMSHILLHTGRVHPYKCSKCSFRASQKSLLKKHMLIHGEERRFKCEKCNAAFKTNYSLHAHRRIHSTGRPFKCPICRKAFKVCTQMKVHYRTHSDKKPYSCSECEYTARFPILLRKHARKHLNPKRLKVKI